MTKNEIVAAHRQVLRFRDELTIEIMFCGQRYLGDILAMIGFILALAGTLVLASRQTSPVYQRWAYWAALACGLLIAQCAIACRARRAEAVRCGIKRNRTDSLVWSLVHFGATDTREEWEERRLEAIRNEVIPT